MNDIVLDKKESIERCVKQIRTYYAMPSELPFGDDFLKQDAIAINFQRTCEQSIDLANHTLKTRKLGFPKTSKNSFSLLAKEGVIPLELAENLANMDGFRNTLVYQYQDLDIELMQDVILNNLDDLIDFTNFIVKESLP